MTQVAFPLPSHFVINLSIASCVPDIPTAILYSSLSTIVRVHNLRILMFPLSPCYCSDASDIPPQCHF
jgi:hypothetical protein